MHTLTVFVRRHGARIDWSEIRTRMSRVDHMAVLAAYLDLAHRFMALPSELAPPPTLVMRARRAACAASADLDGRPGDMFRNLQDAFDADYLRARYGTGRSVRRLRAHHAATLWRARGKVTLSEASAGSQWR
jgi:hypothetical protein